MRAEFFMDLCFIREVDLSIPFTQAVEQQLQALFGGEAKWYLESRQEENLELVLVEVKGAGDWETEEDLVTYLDDHASDQIMTWLQGYRIELDIKEQHESCVNCGKDKLELEVS